MDKVINVVQRCIVQATVESAYRLYNVNESHRLFSEGLYKRSIRAVNEAVVPPPIWVDDSSKKIESSMKIDSEPEIKKKKIKIVDDSVSSYTFDELFLDSVSKVPSFGKLNLSTLSNICRKIGMKKFTTMKKDTLLQELYKHKEMYNLYPCFRFKHFYRQEQCNATGCKKVKNLKEVYGMQWKYCSDHQQCTSQVLQQWDKSINTTFWDINNNTSLSMKESNEKFHKKDFAQILDNITPNNSSTPFPLDSFGISKSLLYEKIQSKGTLRANLIKGKNIQNNAKKTAPRFSDSMQPSSPIGSVDGDIDTFDTSSIKHNEETTEMECEIDIDLDDNDDDNGDEDDEERFSENEEEEEEEEEDEEDDTISEVDMKLKSAVDT